MVIIRRTCAVVDVVESDDDHWKTKSRNGDDFLRDDLLLPQWDRAFRPELLGVCYPIVNVAGDILDRIIGQEDRSDLSRYPMV